MPLAGRWLALFLVLSVLAAAGCSAGSTAQESWDKGLALGMQGKFAEAQTAFEQSIKADPFYVRAKFSLEILADLKGQKIQDQTARQIFKAEDFRLKKCLKESLDAMDQAIRMNPGYGMAYRFRGLAYLKDKQLDLAIADFNQALALNPKDGEAYHQRAHAHCDKGEFELCLADFNRALEIDPRDADTYVCRGYAYYKKGKRLLL